MTKSNNFLATSYHEALATIDAYNEHRLTGHRDAPPRFRCPSDELVEKLLVADWPTDEPEDQFRGLFDMCVACNLMWGEPQTVNPLLNVLCKYVDHNLMAMLVVCAMKWKEARERLGLEEVKEFRQVTEIELWNLINVTAQTQDAQHTKDMLTVVATPRYFLCE